MIKQELITTSNEYHAKQDGILVKFPSGRTRFLTLVERVLLFFGKETTR